MKIHWMKHFLSVALSGAVLIFIYGAFACSGFFFLEQNQAPSADFASPVSELWDSSSLESSEDPFAQTAVFTEKDLANEISNCQMQTLNIAPHFGASILLDAQPAPKTIKSQAKLDEQENSPLTLADSKQKSGAKKAEKAKKNEEKKAGEHEAFPDEPEVMDSAEPDIWRIETAYASKINPDTRQFRKLVFYRWENSRWKKESRQLFMETQDPRIPLIFYVHGNRTELNTAAMQGIQVLEKYPAEYSARLVIWSWDASRVACRPRIEYSTKARFADFQGFYLANVIRHLPASSNVTLVGHSFGCRTVLSALHLLGEGKYSTRSMASSFKAEGGENPAEANLEITGETVESGAVQMEELPEINALLVASAVSFNAMNPKALFSNALTAVNQINVTQNPSDPALKYYPMMNGSRSPLPEAMGFVGPSMKYLDDETKSKIRVIPMNYPTHQFLEYIQMRSVQNGLKFSQN